LLLLQASSAQASRAQALPLPRPCHCPRMSRSGILQTDKRPWPSDGTNSSHAGRSVNIHTPTLHMSSRSKAQSPPPVQEVRPLCPSQCPGTKNRPGARSFAWPGIGMGNMCWQPFHCSNIVPLLHLMWPWCWQSHVCQAVPCHGHPWPMERPRHVLARPLAQAHGPCRKLRVTGRLTSTQSHLFV